MKKIIECVPNFSEGRDRTVIDRIVAAIASVKRELGGKWAWFVVLFQCAVAWVVALLSYWITMLII